VGFAGAGVMIPRLTEQQDELDRLGGCVEFEDANGECVLMSIEALREIIGIRDFQEFLASLRRPHEQRAKGHAS
jgi:hypothetical protein